jgi:hypothetical protein
MSGGNEPPAGTVVAIALRICREHWPTLAVYGLLAGVPVAALDAANALARGVDPFATPLTGVTDATAAGGASTVSSVLALVLYAVASAATVHTVAAARDGRRTGWQEGLGAGIRRVGGVVAASIIVLALVLLGLLALVLPGIWIAVALALTTPALVLERLPALAAVRRSFTMVRGRWWRTAGVVALTFLVAFAAVVAVSVPAGVLAAGTEDPSLRALIAGVVNALSTALLVPLTVGPMTVLFLARRASDGSSRTEEDSARYRGFSPPVAPERVVGPGSADAFDGPLTEPDRRPSPPSAEQPPRREPPSAG